MVENLHDVAERDGGEEEEGEEVFMPETSILAGEGTVVADLQGQASEGEDEEDQDGDMMLDQEEMEMEMVEEEFVVERNDACSTLETKGTVVTEGATDGRQTASDDASASKQAPEAGSSGDAGHGRPIYSVRWNKVEPSIVACGGEDDCVRLWKPFHTEGPNSITLAGHDDSVVALDFDSSGKLLASGGMDGRVCVWSTMTGRKLCTLEGPGEAVEFVKWHPLGSVVLAGSEDFTMWMWNIDTRNVAEEEQGGNKSNDVGLNHQCMQVFTGHNKSVTSGGFTPNGKLIVTTSLDGTVKVWNPRTGECLHTFFQDQMTHGGGGGGGGEMETEESENGVTCLDFSPDSTMVLCGGIDCTAHLLNIQNYRELWKFGGGGGEGGEGGAGSTQVMGGSGGGGGGASGCHQDSVETVSFHPSGHPLVATGSLDGSMIVWDVNTMTPRVSCVHPMGVIKVLWANPKTTAAVNAGASAPSPSSSSSGGQPLAVHDLCLYTCCLDGRVRLWDGRSGKCEREFQGFTKAVLDLDVAPDGRYALAGSDDGTARVFMATT